MAHKPLNLGAAIMQPGRQASAAGNVVALGGKPHDSDAGPVTPESG